MSYPRHSVIWRDCEKKKWWLDIVREEKMWKEEDIDNSDYNYTSKYAETVGEFDTKKEAIEFLDNYANIGFETPVLDPDIFDCLSYPDKYIDKEDEIV